MQLSPAKDRHRYASPHAWHRQEFTMEKQHSRILTALMVIGALSIPLAADSLTGGGSAGSSGSVGGNAGNVGGSVGGNVGTSVDGTVGGGADSAVGGHVDGSINGANAGGAAGTEVNADASGSGARNVVDQASAGLSRTDAAVRSDFRDFSDRLDSLDKRIDENVDKNVYTIKEAAERHADLAALRARLRDKAGEIRRLSVAQRNRLESAIAKREKTITVDANSDDSSESSADVNGK
jgi:hypothetical protein